MFSRDGVCLGRVATAFSICGIVRLTFRGADGGHCCLPDKATISELARLVNRCGSNSSEEFIKVGNTNLTVTGLIYNELQAY
jgi:hypothetical protein